MTLDLATLLSYGLSARSNDIAAAFPSGIRFEGELGGVVDGELTTDVVARLAACDIDLVQMVEALELVDLSEVREAADAEHVADLGRLSASFRLVAEHAATQPEPLRDTLVAAAHAMRSAGKDSAWKQRQDSILRGAWRLLAAAE